jgi:hypothetical protein
LVCGLLVVAEWILKEVYIPIIPINYQESPNRHCGAAISSEPPPLSWSRRHRRGAAIGFEPPPPSSWSRRHCRGVVAVIVEPPPLS